MCWELESAGPEILHNICGVDNPEVAAANEVRFQATRLIDPVKSLGSWSEIDAAHFAPGAILDQLLAVAARTGDGADQDSSSPISR